MMHSRWTIGAAVLGAALALSATPALAKGLKVGPGLTYTSIQAAIDAASAGDKIIVMSGTYQEGNANIAAVTINKSLKLVAKSKKGPVTIVPNPGQQHGILVEGTESARIDGLQIKGFTVQGFPNNGIWLRYVDNFKIGGNSSIDNLENGIWITLSIDGQVKKNVVYGSADSALSVEASWNVRVRQNELFDSATGLEITISTNVEASKNIVHDNTIGVGLYHPNGASMDIPLFMVPGGWVLEKNHIYANNRPNSAPPTSLTSVLPPGGGILVLGVDGVVAAHNLIEDNDFYGIAIMDYCAGVEGGDKDCDLIPHIIEGFPELNRFEANELINNGTDPVANLLAPYAADVTAILTDIYDPEPSPPYGPNTVCGTKPAGWTLLGVGSPSVNAKC